MSSLSRPDLFNEGEGEVEPAPFLLGLTDFCFIGDLLFDLGVILNFIVEVFMIWLCYVNFINKTLN
jgi:hypothetical protein